MLLIFTFRVLEYSAQSFILHAADELGQFEIEIPNNLWNVKFPLDNLKTLFSSIAYGSAHLLTTEGKEYLKKEILGSKLTVLEEEDLMVEETDEEWRKERENRDKYLSELKEEYGKDKIFYRRFNDRFMTYMQFDITLKGIDINDQSWELEYLHQLSAKSDKSFSRTNQSLRSDNAIIGRMFGNKSGLTPENHIEELVNGIFTQLNPVLAKLFSISEEDFLTTKDAVMLDMQDLQDAKHLPDDKTREIFLKVRKCERAGLPTPGDRKSTTMLRCGYDYNKYDAPSKPLAKLVPENKEPMIRIDNSNISHHRKPNLAINTDDLEKYMQSLMTKPDSVCDKANRELVYKTEKLDLV